MPWNATRVCVFSQSVRPNWFKFDVEDPHTYKNTSMSLFLKKYICFFSSDQKLDPRRENVNQKLIGEQTCPYGSDTTIQCVQVFIHNI